MNLIEAIKSGKRIRQKSKNIWLEPKDGKYFSVDQILADDWEIEEATIAITGSQFDTAYKLALVDCKDSLELFADCLKWRLGL